VALRQCASLRVCILISSLNLADIPRMTLSLGLRLSLLADFGNASSSTRDLPCFQAEDQRPSLPVRAGAAGVW